MLLILLPILLTLLLSLNPIQNRVAGWAATFASRHIGTEVNIGQINVTMRGGVEISNFLVRDLQADTLLYVERVETQIMRYLPVSRNLRLGNSIVEGAVVNLRARECDDGTTEMNMRQVVKRIAQGSGGGRFILNAANIVLERSRLTIEQLTHNNPEYGVDSRNMDIREIAGAVTEFTVDGPMVHGFVERLSAREVSGFEINNLAGELYLTDGALAIQRAKLRSGWSSLEIDQLMLVGRSWGEYRDFIASTYINIEVSRGRLASDDIAYFAPAMRNWGLQLRNLDLKMEGEIDNFALSIREMEYGDSTHLAAEIDIEGLPHIDQSNISLQLSELATTASDIEQLKLSMTQTPLAESTLRMVEALGDISLYGEMEGSRRNFSFATDMLCDAGEATTKASMNLDEGVEINGELNLDSFAVGKVVGRSDLGNVTMTMALDGKIDGEWSDLAINSRFDSIAWRGDSLQNITLSGAMREGGIEGLELTSRDPQIDLNLSADATNIFARVDEEHSPRYNIDLTLNNIDLKHFEINKRDTTSSISTHMTLRAGGDNIESCWLDMELDNTLYRYNSDTLSLDKINVAMLSEEGARSLTLNSGFAQLDFLSPDKVTQIVAFAKSSIAEYLPALYDKNSGAEVLGRDSLATSKSNSATSYLRVKTRDLNPVANAFVKGINIGDDATFEIGFNPNTYRFDAELKAPYIEQGTTLAIDCNVLSTNRSDSLTMRSRIGELFVGTSFIENATLSANARDNNIDIATQFVNPADSSVANVAIAVGVKSDASRGREIDMRLLPSTIERRNQVWRLSSKSIVMNRQGVDIEQFKVESRNQSMTLNGRASRSTRDTVSMKLQNFDLSIFSTLIAQLGYHIEGRTNGEASISAMLGTGRFDARVELDSVSVNTLQAPPMLLQAEWNSKLNRARLLLSDRNTCDTLIRGYYVPTNVRYYAELKVDSVQMAILDPPLGGVITDTEGLADLSLVLQGTRRNARLNGEVAIHNVSTTVDYTKTRYTLPSGVINVNNNKLSTAPLQMIDGHGGSATLELEVDLQHLSNIWYKVRVVPRKLLVLDTDQRDNDQFYGHLFASGVAEIEGDKGGVKMDIAARSEDNSYFFMPLTNKSNISTADFITFVQPAKQDSVVMTERRRLMLERNNRVKGNGTMSINLALDIRNNTELQLVIDPTVGDIIKARGEGRMNMKIEPQSNIFDMYGDYTITDGNYLFTLRNIVNKRFVIDPGSTIQWTGSPANPLLDINAIYELKTSLDPILADESTRAVPVNCIINLSDRLTQPDVSFAIDLPTADPEQQQAVANLLNDQEAVSRQFFYLMLANSFISESAMGGTSDFGVNTTAATGFELLTNQLSNWLSSSNYNVIIRYRPESELTGEEVDFGFSKGWVDNRLLVELEGNYIIDNKQAISEDASNFLGEAYITWLIDRAGALKLRGFTQTIDTYDENQGLQETGIGIYYRENFENFRDLRERVKARFRASEERLEQREERRAERAAEREQEQKQEEAQRSEDMIFNVEQELNDI
ncbi:MAG: translocation/assembly module TamB domain-containing protein [Rikenellaceae bacterium]